MTLVLASPRKEMDQIWPLRDSQSEQLISGDGSSLVLKEAGLGSAKASA